LQYVQIAPLQPSHFQAPSAAPRIAFARDATRIWARAWTRRSAIFCPCDRAAQSLASPAIRRRRRPGMRSFSARRR
jgi:hypothetical protein